MIDRLLDVASNLASTPPPLPNLGSAAALPKASGHCLHCGPAAFVKMPSNAKKEFFEDADIQWFDNNPFVSPTTSADAQPPPALSADDNLLFADDEFQTGDPPPAAPYSDPLAVPGATAFAATNTLTSATDITSPANFQTAVGAQNLGSATTTSFVPPPSVVTPAPTYSSTTSYLPLGLTNTQALVLAVALCTGILLLLFIVGMSSSPPAAANPYLGL